jgi:hypothetical protein
MPSQEAAWGFVLQDPSGQRRVQLESAGNGRRGARPPACPPALSPPTRLRGA